MLLTLIASEEGGGRVGGEFTTMLSNIQICHIINCEDGSYGCFGFFLAKKSMFQGLYNCKLKNEMTLILEFFFAKKKRYKAGKTGSRIPCSVF